MNLWMQIPYPTGRRAQWIQTGRRKPLQLSRLEPAQSPRLKPAEGRPLYDSEQSIREASVNCIFPLTGLRGVCTLV